MEVEALVVAKRWMGGSSQGQVRAREQGRHPHLRQFPDKSSRQGPVCDCILGHIAHRLLLKRWSLSVSHFNAAAAAAELALVGHTDLKVASLARMSPWLSGAPAASRQPDGSKCCRQVPLDVCVCSGEKSERHFISFINLSALQHLGPSNYPTSHQSIRID